MVIVVILRTKSYWYVTCIRIRIYIPMYPKRSKEGILAALTTSGAYSSPEAAEQGWGNLGFFETALPQDVEYDNTWWVAT